MLPIHLMSSRPPYPKIGQILSLLLLSVAAPLAQAQYHQTNTYGELVSGSRGCDLYFEAPTVEGSAVGEFRFVNTTGRNMRVEYTEKNIDHSLYIAGHNNANPSDQSDVVNFVKAPRGTVTMTRVIFSLEPGYNR